MSGRPDTAGIARAPRSHFRLPPQSLGLFAAEEREVLLEHVRSLLSAPTAPYAEDAQLAAIRRFVAARPGLDLVEDEHANAIVTWPGAPEEDRVKRTLAFSAHLDHPGFLYAGATDGVHRATFHGGVPLDCFPGAAVRFFECGTSAALATARVRAVHEDAAQEIVVELEHFAGAAHPGMFGMFDLTPGRMRKSRLFARVCDDLMGAAAILSLLDLVRSRAHTERVVGIFTRAEETGFIGCQALLRSGVHVRDLAVIGLECSPRRPTAKVGAGPVIRVGDRQTVFDPELTHRLEEAAARLRQQSPRFAFQRALMDGGSCESTAYNLWDVPAGGMCLALGNYHNVGPSRADGGRTIAPEFVDWHDFEGLVALMLECASGWTASTASTRMFERMERTWTREYERLAASSRRIRAGSHS